MLAEFHVNETGVIMSLVFVKYPLYASGGLRVLGDHIEITTSTSTGKLIAQTEVVDE